MQDIAEMPEDLRAVYRTAWEIEPFIVVDMAGDRAPFIDQSQSMSITVDRPSTALLVSIQCSDLVGSRLTRVICDTRQGCNCGRGSGD